MSQSNSPAAPERPYLLGPPERSAGDGNQRRSAQHGPLLRLLLHPDGSPKGCTVRTA